MRLSSQRITSDVSMPLNRTARSLPLFTSTVDSSSPVFDVSSIHHQNAVSPPKCGHVATTSGHVISAIRPEVSHLLENLFYDSDILPLYFISIM